MKHAALHLTAQRSQHVGVVFARGTTARRDVRRVGLAGVAVDYQNSERGHDDCWIKTNLTAETQRAQRKTNRKTFLLPIPCRPLCRLRLCGEQALSFDMSSDRVAENL